MARKTVKKSAFSVAIFLVLVLAVEIFFRLHPDTRDAGLFFEEVAPGRYVYVKNKQGLVFQTPKPPGTFRIFCLGGSATVGSIYNPVSSFPNHLKLMLDEKSKGVRVEAINLGKTAFKSDDVLLSCRESLRHQPDLIIVYSGNNELAHYSPLNRVEHPLLFGTMSFLTSHSHTFLAIQSWLPDTASLSGIAAGADDDQARFALENNIYPPERREAIALNYRLNMADLLDLANSEQVPVIVGSMATNLREWPPGKSAFPGDMAIGERRRLQERYEKARAASRRGDTLAARALLDEILKAHPGHAQALFLSARIELEGGNVGLARKRFQEALDNDDAPTRRTTTYQTGDLIKLAREKGATLVPLQDIFNRLGSRGLAGFELLDDYCHPNLAGQARIAAEFAEAIAEQRPDLFRPADADRLAQDYEARTRKLGADDEFLAKRTQEMAFYLAFAYDAPLINGHALSIFERLRRYSPGSTLPDLGSALVLFRMGGATNDRGARELLTNARLSSLDHARRMSSLYFARFMRFEGPFVLLRAGEGVDFKPILNDYLALTGAAAERRVEPLSLDHADHALFWNGDSDAYVDVTGDVMALAERRREAASAGPSIPEIIVGVEGGRAPRAPRPPRTLDLSRGPDGAYTVSGPDPRFSIEGLDVDALRFGAIDIAMRSDEVPGPDEDLVCVYWKSARSRSFTEDMKACSSLALAEDGGVLRVSVADNPYWLGAGVVTAIRVDPPPSMPRFFLDKVGLDPWAPLEPGTP